MSALKIAVLDMNNNHPNEGMRCIIQLIRQVQDNDHAELIFDIFDVRANNELPGLDYDIYVSSGGPGSPMASDDAWEPLFFDLIDQLFEWNRQNERKKYLFLICHSFQLVMRHLQIGELSRRKSTSFGIFPIHKTDDGSMDPLLSGLSDPFFAVDSRNYQVTEPDPGNLEMAGVKILCMEKIRPHVDLPRALMAVRFSDEIVGTQFHPEADNQGMLRHFRTEEKRNQIVTNFSQEKYDEMVDYLQDPDKIARTGSVILPGFLRQAISSLADTELNSIEA